MSDMKNGFLLKLVVAVTSMAIMIDMAIYPAAETIYGVFAEYPIPLINTIITGTSAMVIVGSVLCGFLAQFMGKKNILAVFYTIFCLGTIPCAFIDNIYVLLVMRLISGLSVGFIAVAGAALVAELFVDEKTRSRMMGFYTGAMSAFGVLMSPLAGTLAVNNWHWVFFVYIIAVPILVGIICVIPKTAPEGKRAKELTVTDEKIPWGRVAALVIAAFVFNACFAVLFTMNSVFLAEEALGDAGTAGIIGSMQSIGSLIACFTFGWVYMKTKRKTPVIFAAIMALGYVVYAVSVNLPLLYVAMVFMGAMYGLSFSYFLTYASMIVPSHKIALSVGLVNAAVSLAMFVGPYVAPFYMSIFGGTTYKSTFLWIAATLGVYFILALVLSFTKKKAIAEVQQ